MKVNIHGNVSFSKRPVHTRQERFWAEECVRVETKFYILANTDFFVDLPFSETHYFQGKLVGHLLSSDEKSDLRFRASCITSQ